MTNLYKVAEGFKADDELVKQVQQRLAAHGFNPGPIDGVWGPLVQEAFAQFCDRTSVPQLICSTTAIALLQPSEEDLEDEQQAEPAPLIGQISLKGLHLLKSFEGLRLQSYKDAVGVWTIGYGTTKNVRPGMNITETEAEELLRKDLRKFEAAVQSLIRVPLNSDQYSALVSFTYNVGDGALSSSTLRRVLNEENYDAAAEEFLRWNKGGGSVLAGLTRRRKAERALFKSEDFTAFL